MTQIPHLDNYGTTFQFSFPKLEAIFKVNVLCDVIKTVVKEVRK